MIIQIFPSFDVRSNANLVLRVSSRCGSLSFCTDLTDEEKKLLFAVLDRDGSSRISKEEFMDFGSVLMLEFVKVSREKRSLSPCRTEYLTQGVPS